MKKNIILITALIIFGVITWKCTEDDGLPGADTEMLSLKESLSNGVSRLDAAVNEITQTKAYHVLVMEGSSSEKSTTDIIPGMDSIKLADVSGVYDYNPVLVYGRQRSRLYRLFENSADTNVMIVRLPEEKAMYPFALRTVNPGDTVLANNFEVSATDYHYYFPHGFLSDYKLSAGIEIDSENIGGVDIQSTVNSFKDFTYASTYSFGNGYEISTSISSGDTIISDFSLSSDTGILFKETTNTIINFGSRHFEREYTLTIGNVEIRKMSDPDTIQVYLNGILQENAKVEFIDTNDNSGTWSICHNRDIQITFDDGSVTTISELIGPSLDVLRTLSGSVRNIHFATFIVNYIAWNIYECSA